MENNIIDDITLRIAEAIAPYRKRSERFVGTVPYSLSYEIRKYTGTAQKAEKVNIFNKTIVNLIGRGLQDTSSIANAMGLDFQYDLEKNILLENLEFVKTRLQLISRKNNSFSLTAKGRHYYEKGEYIQSFQSPFEIVVVPECAYFPFMKECMSGHPNIKKKKRAKKTDVLNLSQIKKLAEHQASNVQHKETGLELIAASFDSFVEASVEIYICFMQNVCDNSIRTIIYDDTINAIIPQLSMLFDENDSLRDSLLKKCLKNEVADEEAEIVESGEKPEEQVQAETDIIAEVEEKGEELFEGETIRKSVGSIYDSAEFEKELHEIFENHQNQEIWLISPWIRKYAFLRSREPKIRKFLDQGGAVFIAYSEPEKLGEEMVDPMSMKVVKRLDAYYDRFYYAELPKFHYKNVIEHNMNGTVLYTGSFNVLSFCINDNTEHYRMEQMMLANEESAKNTRNDYLNIFAKKYIERYIVKMGAMQNGVTLRASKLKYLEDCGFLQNWFHLLKEKADEKSIKLDLNDVTDISRKELMALADKITSMSYKEDSYYIQALLSALLFLYEDAKANNNQKNKDNVEQQLYRLFMRNSIYKICRFGIRRGYEDERKTVVRIICNDINFEFGDIALRNDIFRILNKHKETFNYKEENIKIALRNIKSLLYNSAKVVL